MKYFTNKILLSTIFLLMTFCLANAKEKEKDIVETKKTSQLSTAKADNKKRTTSTSKTDSKSNGRTSENIKIIQPTTTGTKLDFTPPVRTSRALIGEQINWQVIAGGATNSSSANYRLKGTLGQTAVGLSSSVDYQCSQGFWQSFEASGCCIGMRGNIDGLGGEPGIDIADLVYFVDYSFNQPPGPEPPCMDEADVDGSGGIDIADIVYMVDYMFSQPPGPTPVSCQ